MPGGGWVATHEDISELARAEDELRRTRTFLDNVIEHLPIMITVKEAREQRYILVNRAAAGLFEVPRAEMLGKQAHDLFPKAEADFFVARDKEALQGRSVVTEHVVNTPRNGPRVLTTEKLPFSAATASRNTCSAFPRTSPNENAPGTGSPIWRSMMR